MLIPGDGEDGLRRIYLHLLNPLQGSINAFIIPSPGPSMLLRSFGVRRTELPTSKDSNSSPKEANRIPSWYCSGDQNVAILWMPIIKPAPAEHYVIKSP
jgi:hypothetical protein